MAKTEQMIASAKARTVDTLKRALTAIDEFKANGEPVNFNYISKKTGISKSFLYDHPEVREKIMLVRESKTATKRSELSKESLIGLLQIEIKELERKLKALTSETDDNGSWRYKYESEKDKNKELTLKNKELRAKISDLSKQLETSYRY